MTSTEHKKSNFTVILCVTADGNKWASLIIFTRKSMPKEVFGKGIMVKGNTNGWIIQERIGQSRDEMCRMRKNALFTNRTKSLLLLDSWTKNISPCQKIFTFGSYSHRFPKMSMWFFLILSIIDSFF